MSIESVAESALINIIADVTTAKSFIISEIPDVLSQLITWRTYQHLSLTVLSVLFLCFAIYWFKTYMFFDRKNPTPKQAKALSGSTYYPEDLKDSYIAANVVFTVITIISSVVFADNFTNLLQITLAPKIYLIEYANSFLTHK